MKDWSSRIFTMLGGCILSLLVLVAVTGATIPTRKAVSQMIVTESPYVRDRDLILYRLEQIEKKLDLLLDQE